jgi:hypothetical protein
MEYRFVTLRDAVLRTPISKGPLYPSPLTLHLRQDSTMRFTLVAALSLLAAPLAAQNHAAHMGNANWTATHDSVMMPIKQLFDGMRAHDSTMIRSAFVPGAVMMGGLPRPNAAPAVRFTPIDGFVTAAGKPGDAWDEQIYDPIVQIDGGLASVWVFYTFHAGTTFTHCGVDALQVVRTTEGWKISVIADTRRTTDCETAGKRRA